MNPTTVIIVIALTGVAVAVAAGWGLDARTARRKADRATADDVAGHYLGDVGAPHAIPLPRWMTALVVIAAAAGAIAAGVGIAGSWGDAAQRRSDQLRSCSSSFSAELVTGPTVAALQALAAKGSDSPEFRAAVDRADPERFIALSRLSRTDPGEFLAECRRSDH